MNEEVTKILRDKKISPSYTRIRILDYLKSKKTHPAVDEIYVALLPEIPSLSKTTVYNTLSLLLENGIISAITIEDTEKRYDDCTTHHGHFKCVECNNIYDFPFEFEKFLVDELNGFEISEKNIYFKGSCKNCLNKAKNK